MSCMFQKLKKRLLFVKQFCRESCVFFEFHSSVFYVKDLITKEVLLSGQSKDGLYVLSENFATSMPQAFCLLVYPPLLIFGIVDLVTQALGF
jgi:hypothetical protein